MKLVLAKVQDLTTFNHWTAREEAEVSKFKVCYVSGLLISEDENMVRIALLCSKEKDAFSDWINIPRGDVLELEVIKEVDWGEDE